MSLSDPVILLSSSASLPVARPARGPFLAPAWRAWRLGPGVTALVHFAQGIYICGNWCFPNRDLLAAINGINDILKKALA
ncbi:MAG: hypothetical protein RQ741_07300 [Wenzhouxiangellaceae bacterium]|nr:hypothetical protein [Wenzhouxiangellaceae bacterium]